MEFNIKQQIVTLRLYTFDFDAQFTTLFENQREHDIGVTTSLLFLIQS